MIGLNDNSLVVGKIKELLHTFNLPACKIGNIGAKAGEHFIEKDAIYRWEADSSKNNQLVPKYCEPYLFNKKYLNITTTLNIRNNLYDRETHRYFGRYLRFLRDYKNVDLMSMYNCFDETLLEKTLTFTEAKDGSIFSYAKGDKEDFITYKIPVSLTTLTICTHGDTYVDMCIYAEKAENIDLIASQTRTQRKIHNTIEIDFYSRLADKYSALISDIKTNSFNNTYLLLKVPKLIKSSIVVLEGRYKDKLEDSNSYFLYKPQLENTKPLTDSDSCLLLDNNGYQLFCYSSYEKRIFADEPEESGFNVCSQLLTHENATKHYVLGDKIIEYITENTITPLNEYYEIERVQDCLDIVRNSDFKFTPASENDKRNPHPNMYAASKLTHHRGIWSNDDLLDLRVLMYAKNNNRRYDALGYLDKELEYVLKEFVDNE